MTVLDYRSGADQKADSAQRLSRHWLAWAVYLGMSWTWCIGMFLPVLLVRDYGPLAWLVFAAPNVLGAAAMGWLLREGQSEQLQQHHGRAIGAFSFVTATFQIFFALWMFESTRMPGSAWLTLALAAGFLFAILREASLALVLCILALVVSLACMIPVGSRPWDVVTYGRRSDPQVLALLPVSMFGFGLCPYLDATFHRGRQALPTAAARGAFSVGFGVFFLLMILLSLGYTGLFIDGYGPGEGVTIEYRAIALHWTVQLALTTALHWQQRPVPWIAAVGSTAAALLAWAAMRLVHDPRMPPGEFIYRLFMSFYGLVFPAYAWLCMLPAWRNPRSPTRRQVVVFAAAVLLAAPFYYLAFIEQEMAWVVVGLGIVLCSRLALAGGRQRAALS
jgi:hypothetical protein